VNASKDLVQRNTTTLPIFVQPRLRVWFWVPAILVYSLLVPTRVLPSGTARVVTDLAWTAAVILATANSFRAARALGGANRNAWLLFASAYAAWAAGQIVWDVYELILDVTVPFPSLADIGYLAFGPLMIAGLLVLRSTQQQRRLSWVRVANLGLILCSLAVICSVMLTRPFTRSTHELGPALIVIAQGAAITIACIIAMYILWSYSWGARLGSAVLVTGALVMHTIAAVFYTRQLVADQYGVSSLFNLVWLVAFALQYWAAESQLHLARSPEDGVARAVQEKQGWVEALIPGTLLLCMAMSGVTLANELTTQMVYFASLMLAVFAVVLSVREALLYSQGQLTQEKLSHATEALTSTTNQFRALDSRRAELEREIELAARAGAVGLWDWDMKSEVVRFSREWKHQLGYDEDEITDNMEEWRSRLHPNDFERMTQAVADFAANPQGEFIAEQRLRHRDGTYRWILAHGTVAHVANGKPQRILGSHVDITDRKMIELSLRESEARYRELVDELERRVAERTGELTEAYRESQNFAYAVAHDLKAPLRAIDGFSHLLEQSASSRLNAEEQGHIKRVRQAAIHMASLIDGLLDYSRLEHRELHFCVIDIRYFVEDMLDSMKGLIDATNADVTVTAARGNVRADVESLRIVVRNLLDNAFKFASPERALRIDIGSYAEPDCIVLTVRDNGIGFDPQYHDKIFEIFNRLHAAGYAGTGIGLALARKAVQRMHGRIWADSELDKGATFYVSLPKADHTATSAAAD
jgi:PAS domain S-box-containing protein